MLLLPLVGLFYFKKIFAPQKKYFWVGVFISLLTGLKFIFLINPTLSQIGIFFSMLVFILVELIVRQGLIFYFKDNHLTISLLYTFLGYLFMKLAAVSALNFMTFLSNLSILTSMKTAANIELNQIVFAGWPVHVETVFNSIHILLYTLLLLFFLILRLEPAMGKLVKRPIYLELIIIIVQGLYLYFNYFFILHGQNITLFWCWKIIQLVVLVNLLLLVFVYLKKTWVIYVKQD
ncbi:MAG: hypothetical protein PHV30_06085 [Candidatus Margulisbacteria bacterium]|nr:hypothetical protein [Candidatus Margulisiibacteriota bacterium]